MRDGSPKKSIDFWSLQKP